MALPFLLDAKTEVTHPQVRLLCNFFKQFLEAAPTSFSEAREFKAVQAAVKTWLQKRLPATIQACFEGCGPFAEMLSSTVANSKAKVSFNDLVQRIFTQQLAGEILDPDTTLFDIGSWAKVVAPLCTRVKIQFVKGSEAKEVPFNYMILAEGMLPLAQHACAVQGLSKTTQTCLGDVQRLRDEGADKIDTKTFRGAVDRLVGAAKSLSAARNLKDVVMSADAKQPLVVIDGMISVVQQRLLAEMEPVHHIGELHHYLHQ